MEGFLCYWFGGLIFGGAYTRRGLFLEFYGNLTNPLHTCTAIYSDSSTQPDRGTF